MTATATAGATAVETRPGRASTWLRRLLPGAIVGLFLRMLPCLAFGVCAVALATSRGRPDTRRALRIVGGVVVVLVTSWRFQPLIGMEQISAGSAGGHPQLTGVPTGLLPIRVAAAHHPAGAAHADPGHVFTAHGLGGLDSHIGFVAQPWLHGWWILVIALACALPLLIALATERPPTAAPS